MKVLVIEDNRQVVRDITFCLQVRYPEIVVVSIPDGPKGIDMVETESPDLVMIDSSLPGIATPDLVSEIREFSEVPLIILYEAETEMDIAKGLEAGADDYIAKPFSPIELLARIRALLRRTQALGFKPERSVSVNGKLAINFTTREVFVSDKRVKLTPTEYRLLSELVKNQNKVITHHSLLEKVWGPEYDRDFSFTRRYIYRLRQKLNDDSDKPQMIHTEHGVGYMFIVQP